MRVAVPHNLTKTAARARVEQKLFTLLSQFGQHAQDMQHEWIDDTLHFKGKAKGMKVEGTVEVSDAEIFFKEPHHPYSAKLMASVPRLRGDGEPDFIVGRPPSLINPPVGCRFAERCPKRFSRCVEEPPVTHLGDSLVKCWLYS